MCMLCHIPMILSLFFSLALVGSIACCRPRCHLLLLLLLSTTTPSLFHCLTQPLFSFSFGSFVSSRRHPYSPSISLVHRCWESEGESKRERERARELVCVRVCVESALSLSCGQMEDGATATSLLVFCAACHRLKGALTLSVFSSIHSPVPELALICDGLSKKKD